MFCPKCSEQQSSEETQFCSKCGFPTKGVKKLLQSEGQFESESAISSRQKGIRRGSKLILLSLVLFPAFILLTSLFPPDDKLVEGSPSNTWFEQIGWAILLTLFLAGVARIAYSVIFERSSVTSENNEQQPKQINSSQTKNALPPSEGTPISDFGKWKTTSDLFEPVFKKQKTSGELR